MGEVMVRMKQRLPAARALLEAVQTLRQRLEGNPGEDDSRQLDQLCAGRDPAGVEDNLRVFISALDRGDTTSAIKPCVKIGVLLTKGA